jgi:hypothetical protein
LTIQRGRDRYLKRHPQFAEQVSDVAESVAKDPLKDAGRQYLEAARKRRAARRADDRLTPDEIRARAMAAVDRIDALRNEGNQL